MKKQKKKQSIYTLAKVKAYNLFSLRVVDIMRQAERDGLTIPETVGLLSIILVQTVRALEVSGILAPKPDKK